MSDTRCRHGVVTLSRTCEVARCYECEPLSPEESSALIDELTEAQAKSAYDLKAAQDLKQEIATARAAAMEEFRKAACLCGPGLHYDVKPGECHVCKTAARLSALPPSVVCVPVETWERVKDAGRAMLDYNLATPDQRNAALANARASALEEAARKFEGSSIPGLALIAQDIRSLSTTPPSGRFVANEYCETCHHYRPEKSR